MYHASAPAPVVLGSGKSWIALRESQDQAFPVTITSGQPTQADIGVRDALPGDADAYVKYWHHSGDRIKNLLRIN